MLMMSFWEALNKFQVISQILICIEWGSLSNKPINTFRSYNSCNRGDFEDHQITSTSSSQQKNPVVMTVHSIRFAATTSKRRRRVTFLGGRGKVHQFKFYIPVKSPEWCLLLRYLLFNWHLRLINIMKSLSGYQKETFLLAFDSILAPL